jgi:DNA repair protein RadD
LTAQNRAKFGRVNPGLSTSVSRDTHLAAMPTLDLLVIDEAQHAPAPSYRRIIDSVRDRTPEVQPFGVTATPNRGDGQGLR